MLEHMGQYAKIFITFLFCHLTFSSIGQETKMFLDKNKSINLRIEDLLQRLTIEEKVSLLGYQSHAIPRLGIPAYNWWNEALHGVARAGEATVFPQAISLAAAFNDDLLYKVADAISTEARAKYNLSNSREEGIKYMGLTFWSPNVNIFRDPRWGRGQETYGEDPYLTARMGCAFVKGMQGNNPNYLKTAACAKHFAVHSGPEEGRSSFNAIVDEKDLRETYLPAFHKLVESGVESVMGAYNRLNGVPCNINEPLLDILRKEWGFKGHLVTDCGALDYIWRDHKTLKDRISVAVTAIKSGVNLDCSDLLQSELVEAVDRNMLAKSEIDSALVKILRTQFKLGFYDSSESSPYASYGVDSVRSDYHISLAKKIATQGMVLLKNENKVLPLRTKNINSVFVTGSNSFSADALLGNYRGISGNLVTFVEGITTAMGPAKKVIYEMGCDFSDSVHFGGIHNASESDVTIAVIGLTPMMEGENGDAFLSKDAADRKNLDLPPAHVAFLKALRKSTNKPIIAVVTSGSAVDISQIEPYADAIILSWYSGEQGGNALADILFGKVSPSGRLPVTFYRSVNDLPEYTNYQMTNRTYRYCSKPVQYPFGFGLSFTDFSYQWGAKPHSVYNANDEKVMFSVKVKNTGTYDADEVSQIYIIYPTGNRMPLKELKQFSRQFLKSGEEKIFSFSIPLKDLQKWNLQTNKWQLYKGVYKLAVGGDSLEHKLVETFTIK